MGLLEKGDGPGGLGLVLNSLVSNAPGAETVGGELASASSCGEKKSKLMKVFFTGTAPTVTLVLCGKSSSNVTGWSEVAQTTYAGSFGTDASLVWPRLDSAGPLLPEVALFFFRLFSSPSGQLWHRAQSAPLEQLVGFQNHAQGLQSPLLCNAEPLEVRPGGGDEEEVAQFAKTSPRSDALLGNTRMGDPCKSAGSKFAGVMGPCWPSKIAGGCVPRLDAASRAGDGSSSGRGAN
jgi:hypothetical protein